MLKKFILTFFVFSLSLYSQTFSAYSIPVQNVFSDIKSNYKYIKELQALYDKGMIFPDSNGKFNPNSLLKRDEFAGILLEVTCKKCIQPNVTYDLINKYEKFNVFYDINKTNKYFYCVADGTNNGYISGYHPGAVCEDGTKMEGKKPFCPSNTIVLEEALSIILKASGILTNKEADKIRQDIYDGKITTKLSDDVSPKNIDGSVYTFYPDFQKALDYELVDVDKNGNITKYNLIDVIDGKIRPKQAISKEAFLKIAFVAMKANSCIKKQDNTLALNIIIKDSTCSPTDKDCGLTNFDSSNKIYDFTLNSLDEKTIKEPEGYIWRFYNNDTGEEIKKYGKYVDNFNFLSNGKWTVFLRVVDNLGKTSETYTNLFVNNNTNKKNKLNINNGLSINIITSNITGKGPLSLNFDSIIGGGEGPYTFYWDFGDGNISYGKEVKNIFKQEGVYDVILYVTDKNGLTTSSKILVKVEGISTQIIDTDNDGINDDLDLCPLIVGSPNNKGCPILEERCSSIKKCRAGSYCNDKNVCALNTISDSCEYRGGDIIFGNAICNSCPCSYSLDFNSNLRKCDVIFPAVTSPDSKNIYSKGKFYQLK